MSRKEVSMIGNLTRDMMRDVMETSLKKPIQTGEFRKNPVEPAWRCPGDYIYELVPTEKFVMEYLKPKQAVTGRVVLQLHGGGYIGPMKNIYRRFAVKYSELGLGADVLTPDYRVAPEHPFPAALEDAVYAYKWLLNEKKYDPEQIVIAGDSAGGGLALALCLYAKDHALPLPAGIITMSPWTDVTLSGASYEKNYTIDPLFGNSKENDYSFDAVVYDEYARPSFDLYIKGEKKERISLGVQGEHNVYNALGAIAVAMESGAGLEAAGRGLLKFTGTNRRFEKKGELKGITIIDDYAHHPQEIEATLKAAENYPHKRICCAFQPHTYTRTKAFMKEFAQALSLADCVMLTDIYPARETDTLGVSSADIVALLKEKGVDAWYLPTFDDMEKFILENCTQGDLLITMGAGDIVKVGEELLGL